MAKILYVASEAYPLAKTGGLGHVAGTLPHALAEQGEDIRLMLPGYPQALDMAEAKTDGPRLTRLLNGYDATLVAARMPGHGLPVWLVDCPELYRRDGGPYGPDGGADWPDNHLRFAVLGRAAALLGIADGLAGFTPDIIHANDWPTGLTAAYLKAWGGPRPRSVFTIHNMSYQGLFPAAVMAALSLPEGAFSIDGVEFWGQVSFLKAGLAFSDRLTTVSPTYARQIQSAPEGEGLEGLLARRAGDLVGILNGIDDAVWNPATDPLINQTYSAGTLARKQSNKLALQQELGLTHDPAAPLIGLVSRLVEQKGIDLVMSALPAVLEMGAQVVALGTGTPALEQGLSDAAARGRGKAVVRIDYDEALSHRIVAGADMLVVPSRFEPGGLIQLFAHRYGTLPIVRETGGLADTVTDAREGTTGDGFLFKQATADALTDAVARAIALYGKRTPWRALQRRAMARDHSWRDRARQYTRLYAQMLETGP